MFNRHMRAIATIVLACGCLLMVRMLAAPAQQPPARTETVLNKTDRLTDKDELDSKPVPRQAHRKVYTVKLDEGQVYRFDLRSDDFDTYLRLENSAGKPVAANDDIGQDDYNSRLHYIAPSTGEYRVIASSSDKGKTGAYRLTVNHLGGAEAADGRMEACIDAFADASPAEQRKLIGTLAKELRAKGAANLTVKDAQRAVTLAGSIDESEADMAREACEKFAKIFSKAKKQLADEVREVLADEVLKPLNKLGTTIDITGKTTDGKEFNLKDFKGKVVLVDFWATWCGPCVREIPNIQDAYKQYHSKGFEVIGVSVDHDRDDLVQFLDKRKLPWKSINNDDGVALAKKYDINSFPNPILVGRDGRIVSLRARGSQLHRLLARLIDEKK